MEKYDWISGLWVERCRIVNICDHKTAMQTGSKRSQTRHISKRLGRVLGLDAVVHKRKVLSTCLCGGDHDIITFHFGTTLVTSYRDKVGRFGWRGQFLCCHNSTTIQVTSVQ